jgi:hypothetical protein
MAVDPCLTRQELVHQCQSERLEKQLKSFEARHVLERDRERATDPGFAHVHIAARDAHHDHFAARPHVETGRSSTRAGLRNREPLQISEPERLGPEIEAKLLDRGWNDPAISLQGRRRGFETVDVDGDGVPERGGPVEPGHFECLGDDGRRRHYPARLDPHGTRRIHESDEREFSSQRIETNLADVSVGTGAAHAPQTFPPQSLGDRRVTIGSSQIASPRGDYGEIPPADGEVRQQHTGVSDSASGVGRFRFDDTRRIVSEQPVEVPVAVAALNQGNACSLDCYIGESVRADQKPEGVV